MNSAVDSAPTIVARHLAVVTCISLLCFRTNAASVSFQPHHGGDGGLWKDAASPGGGANHSTVAPPSDILINEPYACDSKPFVVVFVHSAPSHADRRTAIRKSWASVGAGQRAEIRILFVLGVTPDRDRIAAESSAHHDVLQFSLEDTYRNLSLKSAAMLRWVLRFCSGVGHVVKVDDDTFLNTPLLLRDLRAVVHRRFVMGDIIAGARPIRERQSKYYTPASQYNNSFYPTYLSGAAYVISGDLVPALTRAADTTELFWLEDVYVTGLLARRAKAKHIFNGKFAFRIQSLAKCQLSRIIALHRINPEEMLNAWTLVGQEKQMCGRRL